MPPTSNTVQLFNLNTMSGVFPGTRTKIYQRLWLQKRHDDEMAHVEPKAEAADDDSPLWAQLLWYDDPSACVLFTNRADSQTETGAPSAERTALFRIENPQKEMILANLADALSPLARHPFCCGACHFLALTSTKTQDGFPSGRCNWQPTDVTDTDVAWMVELPFVEHQSVLALGCDHWRPRQNALDMPHITEVAAQPLPPMPKAAEFSALALQSGAPTGWRRLQALAKSLLQPRSQAQTGEGGGAQEQPAHLPLVERSGVGAGAEPCFVCQGRLANLGAMVVETVEGDKQTYSVWRCRNCYSYFLSDWVDRWERLDNLETEEHHYRLAPAEAMHILVRNMQTKGSDHPTGRQLRTEQRIWFEEFLHHRKPLSHQVKLGR